MLEKVNRHSTQIFLIFIAILGFALIRNYEDQLFYDPFLHFYKGIVSQDFYPEIIDWKLYLHLIFRYVLNALLSLLIIFSLFKNKDYIKLASVLYVIFFVILMLLFIVALKFFTNHYMLLFYIRRFIIQPLFLLLFVPGFYFQQQHFKK